MVGPDELKKNLGELLELSDEALGERLRSQILSLPSATLGRMVRVLVAQMSAEQVQTSYEQGTLMCQLADKLPQEPN